MLANDLLPLHYNEDCLLEAIKDPNEKRSIQDIRSACVLAHNTTSKSNLIRKKTTITAENSILKYRPIYVLPLSFNFSGTNQGPINNHPAHIKQTDFQDVEMKFQMSFKIPVAKGILGSNDTVIP